MSLPLPREMEALQATLELAHQRWACCDQVIRRHAAVRPFTRIRARERQRIRELERLLGLHGRSMPERCLEDAMPLTASLQEACKLALEQEQTRLRRCRQLVSVLTTEPLKTACRDVIESGERRDLPAYERCGQCRNTLAGGCLDGASRPPSAPPRRCVARSHQDWLWSE